MLASKLRERLPNSNVTLEGRDIIISIPIETFISDIKNRLKINPMLPIEVEVRENNIILKVRVM